MAIKQIVLYYTSNFTTVSAMTAQHSDITMVRALHDKLRCVENTLNVLQMYV